MAVYRQQRKVNPLFIVLGLLLISVVIGTIIVLTTRQSPIGVVGGVSSLKEASQVALQSAQGLDILTIEYPQANEGNEYSGIISGLARAKSDFESTQGALKQLGGDAPTKLDQIAADFATLQAKVDAKAPADEVVTLAGQMRDTLISLIKLIK